MKCDKHWKETINGNIAFSSFTFLHLSTQKLKIPVLGSLVCNLWAYRSKFTYIYPAQKVEISVNVFVIGASCPFQFSEPAIYLRLDSFISESRKLFKSPVKFINATVNDTSPLQLLYKQFTRLYINIASDNDLLKPVKGFTIRSYFGLDFSSRSTLMFNTT